MCEESMVDASIASMKSSVKHIKSEIRDQV
jgi:hypothetical protein